MLPGFMEYDRKGRTNKLANLDDCTDGVNGGDSSMVLKYVEEVIKQNWFKPDVLLLNCGIHDTKRNVKTGALQIPPDKYRANLRRIISLAGKKGISPVWVRTTPINKRSVQPLEAIIWHFEKDIDYYNAIADEVMKENSIPVIDLFTFTRNLGEDIYLNGKDHVHFNEETASMQAAFIAGAVTTIAKAQIFVGGSYGNGCN
ncbi:MAG: SGNH/GDSL hydrolase family protein, partial [bacterium]|nr:SGNH/GDSL hydrolase family protein [bacterium]